MTTTPTPTPSKSSGRRANALPVGCMLDEYRIEEILGAGGFGITYKALDTHLDTWVAIKEYFPVEWSFRDSNGLTVYPNTQGDSSNGKELSDYHWGLERFLDEARVLARIQHPYVVRVKRYFRGHGTAYIVMDYEKGQPLSVLLQGEEKLNEAEVRGLLEDVLPALRAVHEQGYLHRDIKPSNLYLRASDHRVILIDFGAARQAVGRHSQSVTSLVTPGYSPPEQYTTRNERYGAWTDIYALGAVLYRCITGHTPTEAAERLLDDTLEPAVKTGAGRYSTNLLRVIDQMLAVRPDQRFSTVAEVEMALVGSRDDDSDETVIMLPITPVKPAPMFETSRVTGRPAEPTARSARPEAQQTTGRSLKPPPEPVEPDHSDWLKFTQPPTAAHTTSAEQPKNAARRLASRWRLPAIIAGGLALTGVAAMLIWLGLPEPTPQSIPEPNPPPRYRLGQLEPVAENPPMNAKAPASTTAPSVLPPSSNAVEPPTSVEGAEATSPPVAAEEPVTAGGKPEPAAVENTLDMAGSSDKPITEDGTQPAVREGASNPLSSVTQDGAESAPAEDASEPTAGVTGAPLVPGMIPANTTPKVDTPIKPVDKPMNQRAVKKKPKKPKKPKTAQRARRKNVNTNARPWKVIPYDSSTRKSRRRGSSTTGPRHRRWSNPSNPGFNQK